MTDYNKCIACKQPAQDFWITNPFQLCNACLVKLAIRATEVEAERDYAIEQWLRLENKYEPPWHGMGAPWTRENVVYEMRNALQEKKE